MKPGHMVPPVVALAIAGAWLGTQQRSITALERDTRLMREHVEANRRAQAADSGHLARESAGRAEARGEIDWKRLAEAKKGNQGTPFAMRSALKLQAMLEEMSADELVAALHEIAALDIGKRERERLENDVAGVLIRKNPQLALDRFADRLNDPNSGMGWVLAGGFQRWLLQDEPSAIGWFDWRISEGKFDSKSIDGRSEVRSAFERAAVAALISSDPAAAGRRLASLPEDHRTGLLAQRMKPGTEKVHAALIREYLPEKEAASVLAMNARTLVGDDGYGKAGEYLDKVEATPAERVEVTQAVAIAKMEKLAGKNGLDRQAVDEMRAWVSEQAPEDVDRVTGEALSKLPGNSPSLWENSVKLITELHDENPSDELLEAFLSGGQATFHRDAALALASKIADQSKREQVISRLGGVRTRSTVISE